MDNIKDLQQDYLPIVYKVPDLQKDIYSTKIDPEFSFGMSYPKFMYGFHHFIHQSKGNMKVVDQFKDKKKVYYVMSKFEKFIDNYDQDLAHVSRTYFDIGLKQELKQELKQDLKQNSKPDLICRAFFKVWEIFFMFKIIPTDKDNFISAHLAEGPGSFIQATMLYRDKFCKKGLSTNDKFYAVTLHPEGDDNSYLALEKNFTKFYEKEKPRRFFQHDTFTKKDSANATNKDNGDLTDLKSIRLFSEHFKKNKADLVTADGGFDWKNENLQEQEAFSLILGQIITALNIQEKGGKFILKIYESFTDITIKLICVLKSFYKEVYVVKPLTSRKSNSEKYLVCINYNNSSSNKISVLEELLIQINKSSQNINNIFPKYILEEEFKHSMISLNTHISNRQFQSINEIISFINKQNYRGDEYQNRRKMQIEATKYWVNNFYPDVKDFDKAKKNLELFCENIIIESNKNALRLGTKLVS